MTWGRPATLPTPRLHGAYMAKFMLSLRDENFQLLITEAKDRGITVQELIRAVIIPDWVRQGSIVKTTAVSAMGQGRPLTVGNGNGTEQIVQPIGRVRRFATPFNP